MIKDSNNMEDIKIIRQILKKESKPITMSFFKTGPGEYAEHDQFLGVPVPVLRRIAKEFKSLPLKGIKELLSSDYNEERQLALFIIIDQYQKGDLPTKEKWHQYYLKNLKYVNNWNLVDASAHLLVGAHLYDQELDRDLLFDLAESKILWERRVAIVSTWYLIRQGEVKTTFELAKVLMTDKEDLMHKAVGWMLREMGEKDETHLIQFLDKHASQMPRTMLRYSIEKLSDDQRKAYMTVK